MKGIEVMTEEPDALEWAKQQKEKRDTPKKQSNAPGMIGFVVLAAIVGGMLWYNRQAVEPPAPMPVPVIQPMLEVKSELKAEYKIEIGQIAKIDASGEPGESFAWTVLPTGTPFEVDSNGKILYLSSGKDDTFTIVFSSCNEGECDAKTIIIVAGTGVEGGDETGEISNPFANIIGEVPSRIGANKIAGSYTSANGQTISDLIADFQSKYIEAVGPERAAWKPTMNRINAKYDELKVAGKLATVEDYLKMFRLTATAFREAGK